MYSESFFDTVKGQRFVDSINSIAVSMKKLVENNQPKEQELTKQQELLIYRKVERNFRLEDAKRHFMDFAELDENSDMEEVEKKLQKKYGISLNEMYNSLVEEFFNNYDCNIPENGVWDFVVSEYFHNLDWDGKFPIF